VLYKTNLLVLYKAKSLFVFKSDKMLERNVSTMLDFSVLNLVVCKLAYRLQKVNTWDLVGRKVL
jgi:hypothetical protein